MTLPFRSAPNDVAAYYLASQGRPQATLREDLVFIFAAYPMEAVLNLFRNRAQLAVGARVAILRRQLWMRHPGVTACLPKGSQRFE
jgi:hypothetical protein